MKIVVTDCKTITQGDLDLTVLNQYGEVSLFEATSYEELPARIAHADMVLTNKSLLDANVLSQAPNVKYIGLFATGYNNVDIDYCTANGIWVCNAGNYSTNAVAQHTFALILNHYSQISNYHKFVETDGWKQSTTFSPFVFPTAELAGRTIGLIGYGNIAKAVAKIALAFEMQVLVYTRTPKPDTLLDASHFVSLDTLLTTSDIVSVHCPLNTASHHMFCTETFSKMKPGAFFVNTARGGVLVERDLKEALESGHLAGAAVDVLETEPMAQDCVLCGVPNLTITPHIAWAPMETRQRLLGILCENIKGFLSGTPCNLVNPDVLK